MEQRPFDNIVEVAEAGQRNANVYLAAGYKLLAIQPVANLQTRDSTAYVRRGVVYVLGRPAGVKRIEVAPPQAAPVAAGADGRK